MTNILKNLLFYCFELVTYLADDQKFDKMMVEKWPIIQAFALDDYSG